MISRTRLSALLLCSMFSVTGAAQDNDQTEPAPKPSARSAQAIDRIVAIVNDEVITQQELNQRVDMVIQQLQRQGTPLPPRQQLVRQMLERMIVTLLQLQFAKETGMRVDDSQVDRALQGIAQDNNMSLAAFRAVLQSDGVPLDKFRADVRSEMTIARLREREVDSKVSVTENEVDYQLQQDAQKPAGEDELLVAHILIRIPEQASPEQIEDRNKRARTALETLKGGADFGQVSASYSDAPEALKGGSLGWRTAAKLPTLYLDALSSLKRGEVSPVLKSGNGFHIVKLLDRRGQGAAQLGTQTRARHILIKTSDNVTEAEAKRRIEQVKQRLDAGGDFAEIAKNYSEDATASKGGELGWVYSGDSIAEFERAMEILEPNQISDPVQTPLGWHLIQVLERKEADSGSERNRAQARQSIRLRKADEAYQEWLRQLRDRAYVEYRLDERL